MTVNGCTSFCSAILAFVLSLTSLPFAWADDPCSDAELKVRRLVDALQRSAGKTKPGGQFFVQEIEIDEIRRKYEVQYQSDGMVRFSFVISPTNSMEEGYWFTAKSLRNKSGGALLLSCDTTGSANIGTKYIVRAANGKFLGSKLTNQLSLRDVNGDGVDELVLYEYLAWSDDCPRSVAWHTVTSFDMDSGKLQDISALQGKYYSKPLKDYRAIRSSYLESDQSPEVAACIKSLDALIARAASLSGEASLAVVPATLTNQTVQESDRQEVSGADAQNRSEVELWRELKVGASHNGFSYNRTGKGTTLFFNGKPATICLEEREGPYAYSEEEIQASTAEVSVPSPKKRYVAAVCVDPDWGGYALTVGDLTNGKFFTPNRSSKRGSVSTSWMGFTPDDKHLLVNLVGDEGYTAVAWINLASGISNLVENSLIQEWGQHVPRWLNQTTISYWEERRCDQEVDESVQMCPSVGTYEMELNIASGKLTKTRRGNYVGDPK